MKIGVLGPITTESYYGGVAVFDEEIAKGFYENGCDVVLLTDQKGTFAPKGGIHVRKISKLTARKVFEEESLDFALASLAAARYLNVCSKNTTKAYYLHGFFNQSYYGKIKSELATIYQKSLIRNCDCVFANSFFTKMVNQQFFDIQADRVVYPGVSDKYYDAIAKSDLQKQRKTILYAGRLVSAKGVEKLIRALKVLQECGVPYKAFIAGDGPDEKKIKSMAKEYDLNIEFLGRIDQETLVKYYSMCEVFVSLNPSEPFGIVFPEALLAQCKILCPRTGGQVEFLKEYSNSVVFADEQSATEIAEGLKVLLTEKRSPVMSCSQKETFRYRYAAHKILDYISSRYV